MKAFKKKKRDSLIESMDYKIEPVEGEKYYLINLKKKSDSKFSRAKDFLKENNIPLAPNLFNTCQSIEDGEACLNDICKHILAVERGQFQKRETVQGDLRDFFVIENL